MRSDAATDDLADSAPDPASQKQPAPARPGGGREIVLRVVSAAIMAPAGLAAVHFGGWWLIAATALCAFLAAGDWARMAAQVDGAALKALLFLVMSVGAVAGVVFAPSGLEMVALVALGTAGLAAALAWLGKASIPSMMLGAIYVILPFGAFVWIRSAAVDGRMTLFAILAIVWATDIAAYFAGRGFGGPLLSPKDSPNKTWTGAIGAVICAALAGGAVARAFGGDFVHWLVASIILSIVAQAGDLLESRFKRLYGVKDTSGLVPGHGGVLDRLDALMAATVLAALVIRFAPALAPGFGAR
jgi:phosphatidate cytidylyltransferase